MKTKVRRKFKPKDLSQDDLMLLGRASALTGKEFLTFGPAYNKLRQLDLITDEMQLSWYGKKLLEFLIN